MELQSWAGSANLETQAGKLLQKLAAAVPQDKPITITVFGSAPLQILIDSTLTSADVDVFSEVNELREVVQAAGLTSENSPFYIEVCSELNFRTSPRWRIRTQSIRIGACTFILPHPIDILISKLNRLEDKDIEAFRLVLAKTGHPTENELIEELRMAVDLFRPAFDEEQAHDMAGNCRRLWPLIYKREIDPRAEIIAPALALRKAGYGEPSTDHKQELRDALKQ
jgi:hypothetical protein